MGWQPIETAPKDKIVFLYADGQIWVSQWAENDPEFDEPDDEPFWRMELLTAPVEYACSVEGWSLDLHPTHWMPLPEPPQ